MKATAPARQGLRAKRKRLENFRVMAEQSETERDFVDLLADQWQRTRPGIDYSWFGFVTRVQRLAVFINAIQEDFARAHGLKYGEFLVLAALRRSIPECALNPTELFRSLLITSGAITKRVDRLVAMGLVERRADPEDRRGVLVYLTERGRQLCDEMTVTSFGHDSAYGRLKKLSEQDRKDLANLLRRALLAFEQSESASATERKRAEPRVAPMREL